MSNPISRRELLTTTATGVGIASIGGTALAADVSPSESMPLRPLGKTGRMISIVGFGGGSRYLLQKDLKIAETMIHLSLIHI